MWRLQVRPERFELPTLWFEARCSDPLSYGRVRDIIASTLFRSTSVSMYLRAVPFEFIQGSRGLNLFTGVSV
jgi:hypothetical protein